MTKPAQPSHTDSVNFKIYRDRPSLLLNGQFKRHIERTASPETFPGIHPGPIPKSAKFKILLPFEISGQKRPEGDRAPCPMCQPNKYLRGALVWFPELEAVAPIGHCCADKENMAAAKEEFQQEQAQRSNEDFLLRVLPHVPTVLDIVQRSRPAASEALEVYRHLRRDCVYFRKSLKSAGKTGRLTLEERIEGDQQDIGPAGLGKDGRSRNIEFGILRGSTALISDYHPIADLARVYRDCENYCASASEEAALDFIVKLDRKAVGDAVRKLSHARTSYLRFKDRLRDFLSFFDEANIATINNWASHPLNPAPFTAHLSARSHGKSLELRRPVETIRINLHSSMWECNFDFPY